ncbi:hypothetical protein [Falsiroseomonas oryziterrae]|uniref:hypothetical protein n=1 Tax=Falsiroseomonas oryziterrae TaxID=2911368 RepID=UPI001F25A8AE|nr:hypothetical protein [Roseomonas sp. NPKOSM-4]
MRGIRSLLLVPVLLAAPPALAGSQSSNSSSNCSNGRCSKVESYVVEDRYGRRGWVREERWRERESRGYRQWQPGGVVVWPFWEPPRRFRRGDDDDDD